MYNSHLPSRKSERVKIIHKPNVDDLSVNDTIFPTRRVFVVVMELRNVRGWDDYVTAIVINCKQM